MTQALYRRWRSQTFDEVVGQEHVTQTLRNALRDDRIAHAYLFSGPRGTGKTSTARILAKAMNCSAALEERPCNKCPTCVAINEGRMIDLLEIDAASNNGIDDIRELRERVGFRPSEGRYKVYIIDEVHMLTVNAFNGLLKTLEEPPPHARFILATTEAHKIPATVLSRCQRFDFRRIPTPEITGHLREIVESEKSQADEEALVAIARSAQGCMRDAISLLDQMLSYGAETVSLAQVQQVLGAVSAESVTGLVDALSSKDTPAGLRLIQQLMVQGSSLAEFCQQVVDQLRGIMVLQMTDDGSLLADQAPETVRLMQEQGKRLTLAQTLFAIKRFSDAIPELKGGYQPQLPLELALIEAMRGAPVTLALTGTVPAPVNAPAAATSVPAPAPQSAPTAAPVAPSAAPFAAPSAAAPKPGKDSPFPPESSAPPADAAPAPLDMAAMKKLQGQKWKEFLAQVRQECGTQTQAALNSVRDIAISQNTVAFAFGSNAFTRDMIAKPETLNRVADLLSKYLGRSVHLECQMGDQAKLTHMLSATPSADNGGTEPLVEYAITELGAEVIE